MRMLMVWVGLVFVMLYLPNPVNIQRRLIDGIYLPVAMLAAAGLEERHRSPLASTPRDPPRRRPDHGAGWWG